MKYDAILKDAIIRDIGEPVRGCVFSDSKGRFEDGESVSTSNLLEIICNDEGNFLRTKNNVYKVE
jgi:hypothetical protein